MIGNLYEVIDQKESSNGKIKFKILDEWSVEDIKAKYGHAINMDPSRRYKIYREDLLDRDPSIILGYCDEDIFTTQFRRISGQLQRMVIFLNPPFFYYIKHNVRM